MAESAIHIGIDWICILRVDVDLKNELEILAVTVLEANIEVMMGLEVQLCTLNARNHEFGDGELGDVTSHLRSRSEIL